MMLEENPLFHAVSVQIAERVPVDYKAPLTGSYPVLLTVGDMYATDDLGLILLLWRPNLFALKVIPALLASLLKL